MPPPNGPVQIKCGIMCNMITSTTEAELGGLFVNCQRGESIQTTLEELSHNQPATTILIENSLETVILMAEVTPG